MSRKAEIRGKPTRKGFKEKTLSDQRLNAGYKKVLIQKSDADTNQRFQRERMG